MTEDFDGKFLIFISLDPPQERRDACHSTQPCTHLPAGTSPWQLYMKPNKSHSLFSVPALILICLAVFAVYSKVLNASFMLDDTMYIVDNERLRDLSNLWPPYGTRYFGYLSFALNYRLGGLDVFGYHLTNVVIHIGSAFLVYELVSLTFTTEWMRAAGLADDRRTGEAVAILTALVFALHPVQTQAVSYITQRFASLAAFFYLLSLVLFIRWRSAAGRGPWKKALYATSLATAVAAQMTKEISFTLPAVIVLYDLVFFRAKDGRLKYLAPFLLTFAVIPLTMLAPKLGLRIAGPGIDEKIMALQVHELLTISRYDYLLTQFRVIVTYLRLLVLPINQNWAYDYPVSHSLFEGRVVSSLALLMGVSGSSVYLFVKARTSGNGYLLLAAFGVFWFFITLSIESSVIPIQDVIFEHRLYLPIVGAALTFSSLVFLGFERLKKRSFKVPVVAFTAFVILVAAVPLAVASYTRNLLWGNMLSFYEDVVAKSPNLPIPHYDLGTIYKNMGRLNEAIEQYRQAIILRPWFYEAHNNLGDAYLRMGLLDRAAEEFKKALDLAPGSIFALSNMGSIYLMRNQADEAVNAFLKALEIKPDYAGARYNLGAAYYKLGRVDDAIEAYKKAIELNPAYGDAHFSLAVVYLESKKNIDGATLELKAALRANPQDFQARLMLADALVEKGDTAGALEHYRYFIDYAPEGYATDVAAVQAIIRRLSLESR